MSHFFSIYVIEHTTIEYSGQTLIFNAEANTPYKIINAQATSNGTAAQITLRRLESDEHRTIPVGGTITYRAVAESSSSGPIYYRFCYVPDYGTSDSDLTINWELAQDWSTSNTCEFSFQEAGNYVWTVDASNNPGTSAQATLLGGSIEVLDND